MNALTIRANSSLVELIAYWQNKMHGFLKIQTLNRTESVNSAEILSSFYHPWQIKFIQRSTHLWKLTVTQWPNGGATKINMKAHAFKDFIVWWAPHCFGTFKGN